MCEAEENCLNGGWLHPECTSDLRHMTQEEILKLDKWYCEDCRQPRNQSNLQANSTQEASPPKPLPKILKAIESKMKRKSASSIDLPRAEALLGSQSINDF